MWILLFSEVNPFEYSVSTILSPIVADGSRSLKCSFFSHKIKPDSFIHFVTRLT